MEKTDLKLNMNETQKIADIIQVMKEVLKDKDVNDSLVYQFREECESLISESKKEILEIVSEKIKGVEKVATTQKEGLNILEK